MKKKIAILQSNYIPWKGYFELIKSVDEFIIYDDAQFTKNDWRNRNIINTNSGLQWLTIPVYHDHLDQKIKDTKIALAAWNHKHWQKLRHTYSKAPYYKEFSSYFEEMYLSSNETYLSEINYKFIKVICDLFQIKTKILLSSDFSLTGDRSEKLLNLCKDCKADIYVSGPKAKEYLNTELFELEKIAVDWFTYGNYPTYPQIASDFNHNVSIVDTIFCAGVNQNLITKS
ncbi:WbqC family protein [Legionella waltersii]|uniref:WbqC-like protein family protein n=1 Tax=Legionella waltersii TaxID=66969 RepID=A0A0W1AN29_9GAMM|nr:WbqC family protein [Legionella waltersii]KTD82745.1 WbqC-like protein family protein [Legionella waltersii]SNV01055.1 WbqC-like protein family [Legionella waltersii]